MNLQRYSNLKIYLRHALVAAVAAITALGAAPAAEADNKGYRLKRAGTCNAVRGQLVEQIVQQLMRPHYRRHYHGDLRGIRRPSISRRKSSAAESRSGKASGGPGHYTGTNNQVMGVDEADRVKTDGKYVYTVYGNEVLIIKSWPANATRVVARYKPGQGARPQRLFLNGDKLVVFSQTYSRALRSSPGNARRKSYRPYFTAARATILNIADRTSPRLIAHVDLEGSLLQARMIGSDIYMVTNNQLQLPASFWQEVNKYRNSNRPRRSRWFPGVITSGLSRARLERQVRAALAKVKMQQTLPTARFSYGAGHQPSQRPLLGCNDLYFPAKGNGMTMVTLSHLSLNGGRVNASAVMGQGMKIYASESSLYVAANNWRWTNGRNGTQIHKFDLRAAASSRARCSFIPERPKDARTSALRRSRGPARRTQGPPRYAASGVVPGYLLNQFSLDEHRGYLRVATTDNGWRGSWRWRGRRVTGAASNIVVLQQRQGELATVGSVRGMAPGERIYAARMVGDQGYLVTFRQTDPLFTIDLSNPRAPRVMGELKIPGFSSYIHPIASGQLLTVGQDADERGRVKGAHLQIFDVTDLKNPRRTHHYKLTLGHGSSRSAAQWDHHAFTYNTRTRTLALPLTVYRYHKNGGNFAGVVLVKADPKKGFADLGAVEHRDLAARTRCATSSYCGGPDRNWNVPVQRSIFMDDNLYTLSSYGLKVNKLPKLQTVASVLFANLKQTAFLR